MERSGGLHKRSAEDWGYPLRRAIGAAPLSGACLPYARASARMNFRVALRQDTGRRVGSEERVSGRSAGGDPSR